MKKISRGFSLLELMVSVGIIISLTAVGVPQYLKYKNSADQKTAIASISSYIDAYRKAKIEGNDQFKLSGKVYVAKYPDDKNCDDIAFRDRICFKTREYPSSTEGMCLWSVTPFDSDGDVALKIDGADDGRNCGCYNYLLKSLKIDIKTDPCDRLNDEQKEKLAELFGAEVIFGLDVNSRFRK